ncbi:MAG: hypothetical protein RLY31_1459 [Bacteroidota bacterium]|jgi:hypothetical protein
MRPLVFLLTTSLCWSLSADDLAAQPEPVHDSINILIRKHGLEQSQVMDIAGWITDVYGPRLTGSPMLDKATDWAVRKIQDMGWQDVHLDEWGPFGRGWELKHFDMHCEGPMYFPILAYPKAWSPSTNGTVRGEVVYLDASTEEELQAFKGKLKGRFVMIDTLRTLEEWEEPLARRLTAEELLDMANASPPTPRPFRNIPRSGRNFYRTLRDFLYEEQPLATIDRSYKGDLGTVFVSGASARKGKVTDENAEVLPQVTMAVEHYNRLFRLLQKDIPVTLRMNIDAVYTNPDGMEHNVIAEIPGTDLREEVVMFGAHFDSWHTATGATDNAAGSAVMLEVARILTEVIRESGVRPRRSLRLALWTGEEQGLYGSRGFVRNHLATTDDLGNLQEVKPEQGRISAYYNLDNGTGRIRGVYLQGNEQVAPIFRAWLDPFKDLGATTLTLDNTGGTDHLSFHAIGIPGFQFIQDNIAYFTRTHHSNMDNLDHLVEDDLRQAATIIASFVWHTAQRNDMLPRQTLESVPSGSR